MKFSLPSLSLLLTLCACAGPPGVPDRPAGPVDWPEGEFRLQGSATITNSAGLAKSTSTEVHWVNVAIGYDDSMVIESSAGLCEAIPEPDMRRAIDRGLVSISCGKARFAIRPAGSTLMGQMTFSYVETSRVRGTCSSYDAQRRCLEYNYNTVESNKSQTVTLRVQPNR